MAEFVAMMAILMAVTALSVDIMLVVLPDIAADFALVEDNTQQYVVIVYLAAFASGHILAGPLSDRIGRRPVILAGLAVHVVGSAIAIVASSYEMLLLARAVQGFGSAGPRVVAVAVIRDRFVGRAMSRVMSFVMTVFIMLPVVAPALGSLIAQLGSWQPIFMFLLGFAALTLVWVALRLAETNPRRGPDVRPAVPVGAALATIVGERQSVGYMVATGCMFGCVMGYVASSQQLFADVYGIVDWFPAVFASVAGAMAMASLVSAWLVGRLGMRRLSHGAVLVMVLLTAGANLAVLAVPALPFSALIGFLALMFFFIGVVLPNFNALAMEPLGEIAGTGSSFVGFVMTGLGALLGGLVGQLYDGTVRPLLLGYFVYACATLAVIALTERGQLLGSSRQVPAE
ncbi:multidrug effflux MFS transporter [Acuticoccus sp.]|uniref:multidrug effflux MFS transporter n=1 Tax=Acuticoccus sp. TaxID=1904378 RepID=UPI003B524FBA